MSVYLRTSTGVEAAILAGHSSQMDALANRTLTTVRTIAAAYVDTGAYMASLGVARVRGQSGTGTRVTDRVVYSTDPGAVPIEYGSIRRHKGARRVTYTPGRHIMGRAIQLVQ